MKVEEDRRADVEVLEPEQIRALSFIDTVFYGEGRFPADEEIARSTGANIKQVEKWFHNRQFNNALGQRGVDVSFRYDPEHLDPIQVLAAHSVFNTEDRRSLNAKLQDFDVTMPQWQGWCAQPRFRQYIRRRALQTNNVTGTMALIKLSELVQDGDRSGVELALRMEKLYTPTSKVEINIQAFVMNVLEVVQKHVQDPIVLRNIAGELEEAGRQALESG